VTPWRDNRARYDLNVVVSVTADRQYPHAGIGTAIAVRTDMNSATTYCIRPPALTAETRVTRIPAPSSPVIELDAVHAAVAAASIANQTATVRPPRKGGK
jgi:hypothetical protein